MKEKIKFQVQLTTKELWQFSMYHANSGLMGAFNLIFTALAFALLVIRWGSLTNGNRLLLCCCLLIFTVLQPLILYSKVRKQAKAPVIQSPMNLSFDKEGLEVEQNGQGAKFTWAQMGRIDRKPTMVEVYMDRVHAYLLPKKAMAGKEEAFYQLVREQLPKERRRGI